MWLLCVALSGFVGVSFGAKDLSDNTEFVLKGPMNVAYYKINKRTGRPEVSYFNLIPGVTLKVEAQPGQTKGPLSRGGNYLLEITGPPATLGWLSRRNIPDEVYTSGRNMRSSAVAPLKGGKPKPVRKMVPRLDPAISLAPAIDLLSNDASCHQEGGAVTQLQMFQDRVEPLAFMSELKGPGELERYLRKRRAPIKTRKNQFKRPRWRPGIKLYEDAHKNYVNEYQYYFQEAARAFGLPETYLTCACFTESSFYSEIRSPSPAFGICQFTDDGRKFVTSLLRAPKTASSFRRIERKLAKAKTEASRNYLATLLKEARAREDLVVEWKDYMQAIGRSRNTRFGSGDSKDPALAIGAAAFYLKYIMRHFDMNLFYDDQADPLTDKGGSWAARQDAQRRLSMATHMEPMDAMLFGVAAYNAGPGRASNWLIGYGDSSEEWEYRLRHVLKVDETANHIKKIRSCMLKGVR